MPPLTSHGKVLLKWQTPEYPRYERGTLWYFIAGVVTVGLLAYSFFSANYLFAIIILIFGIILVMTSLREPALREVRLTELGVELGDQFFSYRDVDRFAIVYQPPTVKNLYLLFKSGIHPRITLALEDQNPVKVREALITYLKEDLDRTEEPVSEFLGRILKI